ncbi:hypothetical protein AGR7A_Cc150010 [Agrobacterium deltaense NCPPB 1641]|uniref:Uncharacterized protein n=1 Tax=Agrobacterium deltaense NCPPB 1641 TaxID=1183425 RepID=A0A1S7TKF2_9HYPH|nr:hypothetical protein AGR7A_Cc150010 [Agrobacterium deltaense NCPPB 1641]
MIRGVRISAPHDPATGTAKCSGAWPAMFQSIGVTIDFGCRKRDVKIEQVKERSSGVRGMRQGRSKSGNRGLIWLSQA